MLRTQNVQPSLWESVLPEICLRLPAELERVDAWLDDDRFFAPFVSHFSARISRPTIPMETYLRLMFLKHRYRLGYETLCAEGVRLDLMAAVLPHRHDARLPHPTTLMKLTTRCGEQANRRTQRRVAGQGGRGEGGEDGKSPRRHHRGVGER